MPRRAERFSEPEPNSQLRVCYLYGVGKSLLYSLYVSREIFVQMQSPALFGILWASSQCVKYSVTFSWNSSAVWAASSHLIGAYKRLKQNFPDESRYPARFRSEYLRDEFGVGEDLRYEVACLAFKPSGAVEFAGH
jgi:hypothetical protein